MQEMIRAAVACDGPEVSPHFGRCEHFVVATILEGEILATTRLDNPGHAPGLLPELMRREGVTHVLAGGAGPRAVSMLADAGIEFLGGITGDPRAALRALAAGTLVAGESTCEH